jgi:hypothetical protein
MVAGGGDFRRSREKKEHRQKKRKEKISDPTTGRPHVIQDFFYGKQE